MTRASEHRKSNKKAHQCDECLRYFACPHNVEQHKREKHTLERPYVCRACGKGFARPFTCNRHVRSLHKLDPETMVIDMTAKGKKGKTHRASGVASAPVDASKDIALPSTYSEANSVPATAQLSDNYTCVPPYEPLDTYGITGVESQDIANYDFDTSQDTSWTTQPIVNDYWPDETFKAVPNPVNQQLSYDIQPRSVPEMNYPSQQAYPATPYNLPATMPPSQPRQSTLQLQRHQQQQLQQQQQQQYQYQPQAAMDYSSNGRMFDWYNPTIGGNIDVATPNYVAGDINPGASYSNLFQSGPVLAKNESAGPMAITNNLMDYDMWNQ